MAPVRLHEPQRVRWSPTATLAGRTSNPAATSTTRAGKVSAAFRRSRARAISSSRGRANCRVRSCRIQAA